MPLIRKITSQLAGRPKRKSNQIAARDDTESDNVRANISAPNDGQSIETHTKPSALERSAPSKAYFEFDDHPARIKANTPTLDTASTTISDVDVSNHGPVWPERKPLP